jgi:hypothetical protein
MVTLLAAVLLVSSGASPTSVPNAENFAACNAEARDAVGTRGSDSAAASPTMKDRQQAERARRGETSRSEDPQLAGIDPEGAKDPAYQAAYRTCMRKSGF